MQCSKGNISTTERGKPFIIKRHGHSATMEFMLVINNWKVEVITGYLAIIIITFSKNLPVRGRKRKEKEKKSFKKLLETILKGVI